VSTSNKRQRELARQKFERQQQRRVEREAARRRRTRVIAGITGLAVVAVAIGLFWYSQRDSGSSSASATPVVQGCTTAPTPTDKTQTWTSVPASTKPAAQITLATNCGNVVIKTLPAKAPKTVQSMTFLAQQGYFTDSDCFRLTTKGIYVF
jgi:peptidyl-prolyl cis-trans isomerase B (cyclophilin B)